MMSEPKIILDISNSYFNGLNNNSTASYYEMAHIYATPSPSASENSMQYHSSPHSGFDNVCVSPNNSFNGEKSGSEVHLEIVEEPIEAFRFRYKSEMTGTHGALTGRSTSKSKRNTFPSVQLLNYDFPSDVVIRCSLFQVDRSSPHAHRLIKKENNKTEKDDPHDIVISPTDNPVVTFKNMTIIHTARKNLNEELHRKLTQLKKEQIAMDELRHRDLKSSEVCELQRRTEAEAKSMNLNIVCLRFDAFRRLEGDILTPICDPVYTNAIKNLKSAQTGELKIVRLDHVSSPAKGNLEVFIFVERVTKRNIKIRFYEEDEDGQEIWDAFGKFNDSDVHHQYAIAFLTPPYRDLNIEKPVRVFMQLFRPSDGACSEPKEFTYYPCQSHVDYKPGAKRHRKNESAEIPTMIYRTPEPSSMDDISLLNISDSTELRKVAQYVDSDEFRAIQNEIDFEELFEQSEILESDGTGGSHPRYINNDKVLTRTINPQQYHEVTRVYKELQSFLKSRPPFDEVVEKANFYLGTKYKSNALHFSIMNNNTLVTNFLIRLILSTNNLELANVQSENFETPILIATACNNYDVVYNLVHHCKARVDDANSDHNTPLHLACMENMHRTILPIILSTPNISKIIDERNKYGDTPLIIAVKNKNLLAVNLLCSKGADINKYHTANGFTPLRFAIEQETISIIKYLLDSSEIDPEINDFSGKSPLQVVMENAYSKEIKDIISKYMKRNNIVLDSAIKQEPEDDDELVIDEPLETPSKEELEDLYQSVESFTPECLSLVCSELDKSETWQNLADLLELGHLLRAQTFDSRKSPTRQLLNYAVEANGDSVKEIRDLLESLDEKRAVEMIDKMVITGNIL